LTQKNKVKKSEKKEKVERISVMVNDNKHIIIIGQWFVVDEIANIIFKITGEAKEEGATKFQDKGLSPNSILISDDFEE